MKIKSFILTHTVLSAILFGVVFSTILFILGLLISDLPEHVLLAVFTAGQILLSAASLLLMRKLDLFSIQDFRFEGMGKGFKIAWFGFVYIAVSFLMNFFQIPENNFISPNIFYLFVVILHPFIGTGLLEEVFFRGLILKILLKNNRFTKKGIVKAIVISSVLFGLVHSINIIFGQPVLQTITQIITASTLGFFFAVVFLRTGKLLIPIFFHGLLNLTAQIFNAIVIPEALGQAAGSENEILMFILLTLFEALPVLIAGMILLRKVKPDALLEDFTNN